MADTKPQKAGKESKPKSRSVTEIEADLAATRDRLARTVDELTFRASPAEIKRKQLAKLQATVNGAVYDEHGDLRLDRIATALGAVAAVAIVLGLARRAFWRG